MTELRDALQLHDLRKENAILRKVNNDLLNKMETISIFANEGTKHNGLGALGALARILTESMQAINGAANDMRFGISEKKEGE